jgi:hypothetical protein
LFSKIAFEIRPEDAAKGSIPGGTTVDSLDLPGSPVVGVAPPSDVVDTPNDGYLFTGWDQTVPGVYPDSDLVIYAVFKVDANNNGIPDDTETRITITFAVRGADADKGSIAAAETREFKGLESLPTTGMAAPKVEAKKAYRFVGWEQAVPGVYPQSDLTIYATFTADDSGNDDSGNNDSGNNDEGGNDDSDDSNNDDDGGGAGGNKGGNGGSPDTGDGFPIGLVAALAALSAAAIPAGAIGLRRMNRRGRRGSDAA